MTLGEALLYDKDTGILTWKISPAKNVKVGAVAGSKMNRGYLVVSVGGKRVLAHRIAWLLANGPIPKDKEIDHINHNRLDNRLINLRLVTRTSNLRNQSRYKNNTSGVTGVSYDKNSGKWRAHITVEGKTLTLGRYSVLEDAIARRKLAEVEHNFHKNHGGQ